MVKDDFIHNCQLVINKLSNNGFPMWLLKKYVTRFHNSNNRLLLKFDLGMELQYLVVV